MIITVAFDVKNHCEVMEGWPIQTGNMTFFLEREGNILKRVCLAFSNVETEHAPSFAPASNDGSSAHLKIGGGGYAALARKNIMNWQAVVSGFQIVDLDYDNYELRFHAESVDEEDKIHVRSFKSNSGKPLNWACDFEQIGRAFCVGPIPDDRVESTSHFREGRIAFEAGRFVDAYNNMFLFLETRYCDGKTGNDKQTALLSGEPNFCAILERTATDFANQGAPSQKGNFGLFKPGDGTRAKIKALVLLRGKLRHHSLKSRDKWDPNKQNEYEIAARFLSAVVGDIVIKESLKDIYAPAALKRFKEISVSTGHEIKIKLMTHRLEKKRTLVLDMTYPTTVVSSQLCLVTVRHAIQACEKSRQLADTVKLEAADGQRDLELFSLAFDVWAYTHARAIQTHNPIGSVRCSFEHFRSDTIMRNEFFIPVQGHKLTILDVWKMLRYCFDHIEQKDPTTRIMGLKLFLNNGTKEIVAYRVGVQVKN